ncbi:hypothetical protein [Pseudomonas antarctica]|uniref:hypothetical protein n=1 Tax=Pseudomonas antarctica TaxID=219572 RepID=UPI003F755EC0
MRETSNGHREALSLASERRQEKEDFTNDVVQVIGIRTFILHFTTRPNGQKKSLQNASRLACKPLSRVFAPDPEKLDAVPTLHIYKRLETA